SAARLPFTKVTFTAGSDGDVIITGVNIERTGLASDAVFSGIALLDENNQQLGLAKTLNSDHKATIGDSFTVKAGQSRTMTIAGNMIATMDTYAGQVAYISVTGVSTTATVTGALPITGAGHTINATLAIGSVTNNRGPLDPNGAQTKNIGATGYTFSSVKFTAGSAEKIRIKSARWNQAGSAASADLANIKTYVDGTAYDAVVSSDGKYYTSTFGTGIVVDKGASAEIYVKGDVVGGSGRTISFDLYKTTDVYITGETYGYGITPPTSGTGFAATNPWYDGSNVTVSNGTLAVSVSTAVPATNIAINLSNQPLGAFDVEVKGEPISVASMVFRLSAWAGTGGSTVTQDITSITLVDNETGAIVAGPKDIDASAPTVSFTDTVTFPVGKKVYALKGKLGTEFASNQTIAASTTPSTDWTSMTGQTTGNSITASPASAITANTMTVKAASLAITLSGTPASQTVVAGTQNFTLANIQLDGTGSGEDVKINTLPLYYSHNGITNLTG
ncbi:MAG: hypothetical protein HY773_00380, partial [Candidatus Terrybacteria bacterium]|nr:hypothetical protein [Candidatus Terrybacteria bacterium]